MFSVVCKIVNVLLWHIVIVILCNVVKYEHAA